MKLLQCSPPNHSLALSVLNKPVLLLTPAEILCLDFTHKTCNTPHPDAQVRVPCVVFLFIVVRTFVLSVISASLILCKQLVCWLFDHPIWSRLKRLNTLTLVFPPNIPQICIKPLGLNVKTLAVSSLHNILVLC